MGRIQWILLGTLSLLWRGSFFFNKILLQELPPLTIVCSRVSLAAISLLVYLRLRGKPCQLLGHNGEHSGSWVC